MGFLLLSCAGVAAGCGSTQSRDATNQLLASTAIDRAVGQIDFRPLAGEKVYFDDSRIEDAKNASVGFANADYIKSALRQQMLAAGLLLQEKKEEADYVVEAAVGTLGTDANEVTYGFPANNSFNKVVTEASAMAPGTPRIPSMPELSVAKKEAQMGACKLRVFIYDRERGEMVWQHGIAQSTATGQDFWFLGAGPFQSGTIYEGPQFAGQRLGVRLFGDEGEDKPSPGVVPYDETVVFEDLGTDSKQAPGATTVKDGVPNDRPQSRPNAEQQPEEDSSRHALPRWWPFR